MLSLLITHCRGDGLHKTRMCALRNADPILEVTGSYKTLGQCYCPCAAFKPDMNKAGGHKLTCMRTGLLCVRAAVIAPSIWSYAKSRLVMVA